MQTIITEKYLNGEYHVEVVESNNGVERLIAKKVGSGTGITELLEQHLSDYRNTKCLLVTESFINGTYLAEAVEVKDGVERRIARKVKSGPRVENALKHLPTGFRKTKITNSAIRIVGKLELPATTHEKECEVA